MQQQNSVAIGWVLATVFALAWLNERAERVGLERQVATLYDFTTLLYAQLDQADARIRGLERERTELQRHGLEADWVVGQLRSALAERERVLDQRSALPLPHRAIGFSA